MIPLKEWNNVYENLCYNDERHPDFDKEYTETKKENCYCDNCFYGRNKLAEKLLSYMEQVEQLEHELYKD